jgi:peptide-methionine (S)-S-oxide reductase
MFGLRNKTSMIDPESALLGRDQALAVADRHAVLGTSMKPPLPEGFEQTVVGMGCFWGAERVFWQTPGVYTTAVGYAGGYTPNPTYEEVCSGRTGHTEAVLVVFDPAKTSYADILRLFWENHNPTQGMRQGNDRGTQYRSAILWDTEEHHQLAEASRAAYNERPQAKRYAEITTEIAPTGQFYYAEDYHQQYLHKNPRGYCGLGGTGVSCPIGLAAPAATAA